MHAARLLARAQGAPQAQGSAELAGAPLVKSRRPQKRGDGPQRALSRTLLQCLALAAAATLLLLLGLPPAQPGGALATATPTQEAAAAVLSSDRQGAAAAAAADGREPSQDGEVTYRFLDYDGEGSRLQTRSCGVVEGARSAATARRTLSPGAKLLADFFPYSYEEDLLYARFMEYWDVVDFFVIAESSLTFSGLPKPLHFGAQACARFAPFMRKVVHVVISPSLREGGNAWKFEWAHRDAIKPVSKLLGLQTGDLLLAGDVDELPTATSVLHAANVITNAMAANPKVWPVVDFNVSTYYFSLYHKVHLAWNHQVKMYPAAVGRVLGVRHAREAWGVEDHKPFPFPHIQLVENVPSAGVHPSYAFSVDQVIRKMRSYSHYDTWQNKTDAELKSVFQTWVEENRSWEPMDGPPRDPATNPELFGYRPEVRRFLIEWTERLHEAHLGLQPLQPARQEEGDGAWDSH